MKNTPKVAENGHFGSKETLELRVGVVDNATFFGLFALFCLVVLCFVLFCFVCFFVCFFLRLIVRHSPPVGR